MLSFRLFLEAPTTLPMPTGMPPMGNPGDLGGLSTPASLPGGGMPPMGGLGGPPMMGGAPPMPGMDPMGGGGMGMPTQPPTQITFLNVWDVLEKLISGEPIKDQLEKKPEMSPAIAPPVQTMQNSQMAGQMPQI